MARHERLQDVQDIDWETKLAIFRQDPWSECEWRITDFQPLIYALLDLALDEVLSEIDEQLGADYRPNPESRKQVVQAVKDVIAGVEI